MEILSAFTLHKIITIHNTIHTPNSMQLYRGQRHVMSKLKIFTIGHKIEGSSTERQPLYAAFAYFRLKFFLLDHKGLYNTIVNKFNLYFLESENLKRNNYSFGI